MNQNRGIIDNACDECGGIRIGYWGATCPQCGDIRIICQTCYISKDKNKVYDTLNNKICDECTTCNRNKSIEQIINDDM